MSSNHGYLRCQTKNTERPYPDAFGVGSCLRELLGREGLRERGLDVVVAPGQVRRGGEIREVLSREERIVS